MYVLCGLKQREHLFHVKANTVLTFPVNSCYCKHLISNAFFDDSVSGFKIFFLDFAQVFFY